MLSKKMAFSLMSLITLLALGFIASPALAADPFDVTFEGRTTVTYTEADSPEAVNVLVTIKTGLSVAAYDTVDDPEPDVDDEPVTIDDRSCR